MKKLALTSLAIVMSASAASAAAITPYAGVNFGYEHAAHNDLTIKSSGYEKYFDGTEWVVEQEPMETSHMGNFMGGGMTMGLTGGAEYRVNNWLGLRGEIEYMYSRQNNANFKVTFEDGFDFEKFAGQNGVIIDENGMWTFPEDFDQDAFNEAAQKAAEAGNTPYAHNMAIDINTHTMLLNVYADFHNKTAFTPYITAGIGYAWTDMKRDTKDDPMHIKDNGLAWQVGAGISYSMTDTLNLDLGYRFIKLATMKGTDTTFESWDNGEYYGHDDIEITPMMHQVRLGARYAF